MFYTSYKSFQNILILCNEYEKSIRVKVCQKAFLNIFVLKRSALRKKILKNRSIAEDLRGKHDFRANKTFFGE